MAEIMIYASDPLECRDFESIREELQEYQEEPVSDEDVWAECAYLRDGDAEDFYEEVRIADKKYPGKWRIEGTLGLWNGPRYIVAEFKSLKNALEACVTGMDEVTVSENSHGRVTVKTYCHDGVSIFELRRGWGKKTCNGRLRELFGWVG